VTVSTLIARLRLVILDTSHFVGLVNDWISPSYDRRHAARMFIPGLVERGWLPLLCWHQLEELLQHENDELVDARLRFLWSLPLIAWIRPSDPSAGPGSVMDVLKAEVMAAHAHSEADVLQVRALVRERLFSVGKATEAIPDSFREWRMLRPALADQQQNARRITAISRWRSVDIDGTRIVDWMDKPLREVGDTDRLLQHHRSNLSNEIAVRGDKRIADPVMMAATFFSQIASDFPAMSAGGELPPAVQCLVNAGLSLNDINPLATFAETMDLLAFHNRLRVVSEASGLSFQELKRTVTRNRLPVNVIGECMRAYAHDQPERKGSELNDGNLLCLAPYADVTYVDKRTLESVRRAKRKNNLFAELVGQVNKAGSYHKISAELTAL